MAQQVKNLPAMQETRVRSPDQEEPLEDGVATHSSILAWRIPWTEEPGGLQDMGSQRDRDETEHSAIRCQMGTTLQKGSLGKVIL